MEPIADSVMQVIRQQAQGLTELATLLSAIAALASVIVACAAVWYTRRQVKMQEQHNRLMVTPHLSGWTHIDGDARTFAYTVENTGIGPAVIKAITFEVDGQQVNGTGTELVENAVEKLLEGVSRTNRFEMFVVGEYVPAGKKFEIFHAHTPYHEVEDIEERIKNHAALIITYESILGDQYHFHSDHN